MANSEISAPKQWVVICCPTSGNKKGPEIMENQLLPKANELGLKVEMILTEHPGHATELARKYSDGTYGLIVVGGDGTLHEVMQGLVLESKLDKVLVAILSQGTMNCYYHSACLPDPRTLPKLIKENSYRCQPMMKVTDHSGKLDTLCFEAVYMGFTYHGAKAAQDWRKSPFGPLFGILLTVFKCNLFPSLTSQRGKMILHPRDGSPKIEITDDFFWVVVSQRSPYNGVLLEDEMWVSYITCKNHAGFGRMNDAFSPPMEFMSSLVNLMENHVCVSAFEFEMKEDEQMGICLDGDPIKAGHKISVKHLPRMWNIVAEKKFPKKVADELIKPRPETECAKSWLRTAKIPEGINIPKAVPRAKSSYLHYLMIGAAVIAGAAAIISYFEL